MVLRAGTFGGLKVLVAGSLQSRYAGARYYSTPEKLMNGLTRMGMNVVRVSDRDLARLSRKFGLKNRAMTDEKFYRICLDYKPHIILLNHADKISPQAISRVREALKDTRIGIVNVDPLFMPGNIERLNRTTGLVDAVFLTTWGPSRGKTCPNPRVPLYFIPNPVDSAIDCLRSFEHENHQHDLLFACGSAAPGDERYDYPTYIQQQRPGLKFNWSMASRDGGLWGARYYETLQNTLCGLNLSRKVERGDHIDPADWQMYSSDRIAQLVGNGLLTLSDKVFDLAALFPEEEMPTFDGPENLLQQIDHYVQDKPAARKAAKAAWQRAHAHYSVEQVGRFIIERTLSVDDFKPQWPADALYVKGQAA